MVDISTLAEMVFNNFDSIDSSLELTLNVVVLECSVDTGTYPPQGMMR